MALARYGIALGADGKDDGREAGIVDCAADAAAIVDAIAHHRHPERERLPAWARSPKSWNPQIVEKQAGIRADFALIFDKLDSWVDGFIRLLPNLAVAAVVLLLFWIAGRLARFAVASAMTRRKRPALANVGGSLVHWSILIAGFLIAATIVLPSLSPGDLLSGLGIGSVAIGFAFKDILQNMLSGILILLRQPFRIGDQIVVGGFEGTVEDIETRATYIKTYDGRRVVIPNSNIYTGSFVVNTAFETVRSEYDVGIGCGDDWEEGMRVMVDAVNRCEGVLHEPRTEAIPVGIDAYQNTIRLRWWTRSERSSVVHTRGRVVLAVSQALTRAGIDMPYPTEVHLFHDQTEETDGDRLRQREGWPVRPGAAEAGAEVPRPRWKVRAAAQAAPGTDAGPAAPTV